MNRKLSDKKSQTKRKEQLGIPLGTASARLRKSLLFKLVQELNRDLCHQCSKKIESLEEFSIEHIKPWLDSENPKELFYDLNNIAFSHMKCNIAAARKSNKKYFTPEERLEADRKLSREQARKKYTTERRRRKYIETGH